MMRLLLFILFLLATMPGMAQQQKALQGSATVQQLNSPQALNNAGVDAIGRRDYTGAEHYLRQAYDLSLVNQDRTRMQTSLGNLSALYQIMGRSVEKGRIDAILTRVNQPQIQVNAEPCSSCWHQQVQTLQSNQLELLNNQNNFDRQTYREDQGFQMMYQRQQLEAQQRAAQDAALRQSEYNQVQQYHANNRATFGTSYMSRYNQ